MILSIECIIFCLLMFLFCFLGTGNDTKNLKSFSSYPNVLKAKLKEDEEYKNKIKVANPIVTFISNLILFLIIIFIFGIFIRRKDYLSNFVGLLILGEAANAFDFFIVDILWFRNVKHTRFTRYQDKSLYQGLENHFISFIKGALMFLIIASIDALILMTF